MLGCYRSCIADVLVDSTRLCTKGWVTNSVHDCLVSTQAMNLGMLSKYNRILRTSTGLSARINVTRGAAAQWCSRRRLISAGIGGSRALGSSSRAVSRPFARPTRASQARGARPGRPKRVSPPQCSPPPCLLRRPLMHVLTKHAVDPFIVSCTVRYIDL